MFDTVKGGDYLVDQDAAEILAREAIDTVIELEHMGLPFNRTPDGQDRPAALRRPHPELRRGPGPPRLLRGRPHRPHDPADALPAVHQARRPASSTSTRCSTWSSTTGLRGASWRYRIADGELHVFHAKAVLLATGGFGRDVPDHHPTRTRSPATACALAYRRGVPLEDMEFYQFHPTGIYGLGILLSEAARGEGGVPAERRR